MNTRRLRSSSRNVSENNLSEDISTSNTTTNTQNTAPIISTNAVTPLASIRFPPGTGPPTHSSPESVNTIITPTYSSSTAREISGQGSDTVRRNDNMSQQNHNLPTVNEGASSNAGLNREIISIREYVSASVEAAQASIMREVQNMQLMLPQLIRESLRSERGHSFGNPDNNQQNRSPYTDNPTPFNNEYRQQLPRNHPNFFSHPPGNPPNIRQQLFSEGSHNISNQNTTVGAHQQYTGYKPITPNQLEKWGLKFDGTSKSLTVEDFVFRVEVLRNDYSCPWDVLMKGFHHLVTGSASTWFWSFRMKHPNCDWHIFKYHMIKKFRNFESDFEIQRKIMERRQTPNESADAFISDIIKLKNQMRVHVAESELVKIVKDNLKDGISQLVFPIRIENLDHLLEECKRAERNIAKRSSHRIPFSNNRKVYEIDLDENDEQLRQVEALQKEKLPGKQLTCWNCRVPGHSFIECPSVQRNIFCYRCGFEDVTSPTCPRCLGNTKVSTRQTGAPCSSQSTPQ